MTRSRNMLPGKSSSTEVDAFLHKLAATPPPRTEGRRGRLIFAMDATASREPTWDQACHIQGQMFQETAALGGLDVQLCFYRGFLELQATPWVHDASALSAQMTAVTCAGGRTQIDRVLRHTAEEAKAEKVNALVFVGDCVEEDPDTLSRSAGELGLLGVPAFVFHEGFDPLAAGVFQNIARLSGGAYLRFDAGSAAQLRDLLSAVAVYAAGGRRALEDFGRSRGGVVLALTHQLRKD